MSRTLGIITSAVAAIVAIPPAQAVAPVTTIRLATFAPANTTWHDALSEMGHAWQTSTEGRVRLTVFPGGSQGTEKTVIAFMRVGQLDAALLLPGGLPEIDDSARVFSMPFFLESDEELAYVLEKVGPAVEKRFEARGFRVLNWPTAGWARLFSKEPIRNLADAQKAKLFTSQGDERAVQWFRSNGFKPVALSETQVLPQLKLPNGMIDAVPSPPYGAMALQFYTAAPYMLDLNIAPMVGATVISEKTWSKIAPADRAKMLVAAKVMQKRMMVEVSRLDANSIAAMRKSRLTVTKLDPVAAAEFQATADRMVAGQRGAIVPADIYDLAVKARAEFRRSRDQAGP
ncbi:MAG: TRAP transporter substrate-binding protein DctP [Gemmatimonadota bacterium]